MVERHLELARIDAMGLRSSCAVSDTRARCRCCAAASRDSMSFSVSASSRISSRASGTGRSDRGTPVAVMRAAPRRSAPTGRSVDPAASQMTQVNKANSTGVPTVSARATTVRLSETELYGTAAMTREPSAARTTSTRSSEGMSKGEPFSSWPPARWPPRRRHAR